MQRKKIKFNTLSILKVEFPDHFKDLKFGRTKTVRRKLSKQLTKRTKLTAEQLARAKGQAANGEASRYDANGNQSLELTRRLAKASKKARKFVVYSEQLGKTVYVGARLELFPMTFDIKEARMFLEGFDEPRAKVAYWNIAIPAIDWMVKHL